MGPTLIEDPDAVPGVRRRPDRASLLHDLTMEFEMAKGKSKRGREDKKPKKAKEKVLATADSAKGKTVSAMVDKGK